VDGRTIHQRSVPPYTDYDVNFSFQDAFDERCAFKAPVRMQTGAPLALKHDRGNGSEQLEGQRGGRGRALATPDLKGPGKLQVSTANVQDNEMNAVHGVQDVYPVGESGELSCFFETGEVDQEFDPRTLVWGVFPSVIEELECGLAHEPTECTEIPVGVVEEAADRGGRLDGRARGQGATGTVKEQIQEDLERIPVLFAREASEDVRIESSGTCILWVHTSF
jgi:hypothetical protein